MAVFKRDKKGNFLDANDRIVAPDDPDKFKKAASARHPLERGMHWFDCHFLRDEHGDGQMYSEYGTNIEIERQDCHGRLDRNTNLRTSGPLAPPEEPTSASNDPVRTAPFLLVERNSTSARW